MTPARLVAPGLIGAAQREGPWYIQGTLVETGEPTELWIDRGRITYAPVPGAATLAVGCWILPGFVDAHCHVGLAAEGAVDKPTTEAQARTDLDAGITLIRDAGSPIDTHWLDGQPGMPAIIRAGRHIARPQRYLRNFGVEVDPADLVAEVQRQARAGDGWVKLVGDWIDRAVGDLTPLWPEATAKAAIDAAHALGVRVTAHCFGEEAVSQLVHAGIDCIEHGTGLDTTTIAEMARRGTALVPTLDNLKIFPGIADQADAKYPRYAAHMRALYAHRVAVVEAAIAAGVAVYAGTDAGGTRPHGTIMAEVQALGAVAGPQFALGAAGWRARRWLGRPGLDEGAPADLIVVPTDPRADLTARAQLVKA